MDIYCTAITKTSCRPCGNYGTISVNGRLLCHVHARMANGASTSTTKVTLPSPPIAPVRTSSGTTTANTANTTDTASSHVIAAKSIKAIRELTEQLQKLDITQGARAVFRGDCKELKECFKLAGGKVQSMPTKNTDFMVFAGEGSTDNRAYLKAKAIFSEEEIAEKILTVDAVIRRYPVLGSIAKA